MRGPRRDFSEARKGIYYLGIALIAIGVVSFLTVFVSAIRTMGDFGNFGGTMQSVGIRSFGGILMVIVGSVLMRIGARGVAGSGIVLDPKRAREDMEPWSRMAGGMINDALDESELDKALQSRDGTELSFDEKLRRLEKLRSEGLLSEEEYQAKRNEFLQEDW